jgi:hypothetical protein
VVWFLIYWIDGLEGGRLEGTYGVREWKGTVKEFAVLDGWD